MPRFSNRGRLGEFLGPTFGRTPAQNQRKTLQLPALSRSQDGACANGEPKIEADARLGSPISFVGHSFVGGDNVRGVLHVKALTQFLKCFTTGSLVFASGLRWSVGVFRGWLWPLDFGGFRGVFSHPPPPGRRPIFKPMRRYFWLTLGEIQS